MLPIVLTVGIGLHSLAVRHYERVLDIAEKKSRNNPDVGSTSSEEDMIIMTLHRMSD